MAEVIGVRFQREGKMYFFDAAGADACMGAYVIVETDRGMDLAEVIMEKREMPAESLQEALKPVIRVATPEDIRHAQENRVKEKEAFTICQRKIAEHRLEMKLVNVEYLFDNSKILFYFTANGRVDFRSLVKDLAAVFHTRIELRQIGVRDEARMLGGLGPCGRQICCGAFLKEFIPVSIKMAKEQNLSLNPTKISGVCGRLMCCLKYEEDHYEETRRRMPRIGREVITPDGSGTVSELNLVRETVKVRIAKGEDFEIREYSLEQITRPGAGNGVPEPQDEEPDELENPEIAEEMADGEPVEFEDADETVSEAPSENKAAEQPKKAPERKQGDFRNHNKPAQYRNRRPGKSAEEGEKQLGKPVRRENPNRESSADENGENHNREPFRREHPKRAENSTKEAPHGEKREHGPSRPDARHPQRAPQQKTEGVKPQNAHRSAQQAKPTDNTAEQQTRKSEEPKKSSWLDAVDRAMKAAASDHE